MAFTPEPTRHPGRPAVSVARSHGVDTMFTLSGAHVFAMYDGAVHADPPMRIIDVRHEQTAAFAAEATGKLTRTPGLAVLTAGPGVTNGVSAIAQARFAGTPMVVVGGRAPQARWGMGSLQELDHPPMLATITKSARTLLAPDDVAPGLAEAFTLAAAPHRGPVFVDVPIDSFLSAVTSPEAPVTPPMPTVTHPDAADADRIARILADAEQPVLILGSDVWSDHAETAALRFVDHLGLPTITTGMARGVVPSGHRLLVTKARSRAFGAADVIVVIGTPLDFRLNYGAIGGRQGSAAPQLVHGADAPDQLSGHADLAATISGDLSAVFDAILDAWEGGSRRPEWDSWVQVLTDAVTEAGHRDEAMATTDSETIHPARIYGELIPRLTDTTVLIGDGGDFVSFAGRLIEPAGPGCWLDPGPFGCLGAGLGAAIAARVARPDDPVVLLLGDGAAGFSLMDVDTLVRHRLPVVMVLANNSGWGLERMPMQMLYGFEVATDLGRHTAYHEVVQALGGAGEMVSEASQIGPALDRAFAAGVPYLVNILTDRDALYPRTTFGI